MLFVYSLYIILNAYARMRALVAYVRTHATETDVRTALILVLISTYTALHKVADIFPTTTLNHFAFQDVRVSLTSHVTIIRIQIVDVGVSCC